MMSAELILNNISLEWDGDLPIFNDIDFCESDDFSESDSLAARVFLSKRKTDILDMIARFSMAMDFLNSDALQSVCGKLLLAFCIISLVNPYKVKVLSGKGIDPLLDLAKQNKKTGELQIELAAFLTFCKKENIPSAFIDWLGENGFSYVTETHIVFRNNFRRGAVILKA